ncbi:hypothetical protein N7492_009087 [Penicillium capsulatum]|uniref:Ribosomal protein S17 n=1 Tax=Penicillium capsulatum TaxID=69766 RepID=A0A9W9LHF7_9EURO|nr:hypothetical protein N7492_009087 [Penicillium capsulatum]
MAPNHLLRAALPIRSIASSMALARSTIVPSTRSISQSVRAASTETSQSPQTPTYPANAISTTSPALQPPVPLRQYAYNLKTGTVTSVGRMEHTVTVAYRHKTWDKHIRKYYPKTTHYLVSDPRDSLRKGDVIEFSSGARKSPRVHHIVERIITPFSTAIEDRPAVMSREERQQQQEARWAAKYLRRESRRLGHEIDLEAAAAPFISPDEKNLSAAELIHRIHQGKERVGKIKGLVASRTTAQESPAAE